MSRHVLDMDPFAGVPSKKSDGLPKLRIVDRQKVGRPAGHGP